MQEKILVSLENNMLLKSENIEYNKHLLSEILNIQTFNIKNYLVNGWDTNGSNFMAKFNGIKILQISVRYGTSKTITNSLPSDMLPNSESGSLLLNSYNGGNGNFVQINGATGKIEILDETQVGQNVVFTAVYY